MPWAWQRAMHRPLDVPGEQSSACLQLHFFNIYFGTYLLRWHAWESERNALWLAAASLSCHVSSARWCCRGTLNKWLLFLLSPIFPQFHMCPIKCGSWWSLLDEDWLLLSPTRLYSLPREDNYHYNTIQQHCKGDAVSCCLWLSSVKSFLNS